MNALSANVPDRREYPREEINSQIEYRLHDDTTYSTGTLLNISQTGALIELGQDIPEDTRVYLLMRTERSEEPPIEIIAEVIRQSETNSDNRYAYGCIILDVILIID